MECHEFLAQLHTILAPKNYLEIGICAGESLALSKVPSIGVDPDFKITYELEGDIQLVRATSDAFFTRPQPLAHLDNQPLDFAFIDGLHHAEFALRDFINVEALSHPFSVIVLDDMLPRDVDEAARQCHTYYWAGDVFKAIDVLRTMRPDLVVLEVDTEITGVVVVLLPDPTNPLLSVSYPQLEPLITKADPQVVPPRVLDRRDALDPHRLLAADFWQTLVAGREDTDRVGGLERYRSAVAATDFTALRSRALITGRA